MSQMPETIAEAYAALEVIEGASEDVVRYAFKAKARTAHPDRGGSEAAFKAIEAAFSMIERNGFPRSKGRPDTNGAFRTEGVVTRDLRCPSCGRPNRVPVSATKVRCGACRTLIVGPTRSDRQQGAADGRQSSTADSRPKYYCDLCRAWYFSPSLVAEHRRRVHPTASASQQGSDRRGSPRSNASGETRTKYTCDLCPAWYFSGELVRQHRQRMH